MTLPIRQKAFAALYDYLLHQTAEERQEWAEMANARNGWFTPESTLKALNGLVRYLEPTLFEQWLANYQPDLEQISPKTVGVIMAGNIPLAGIHDWIAVLVSGHRLKAKLSSQDSYLIRRLSELLCQIEPTFREKIELVEDDLLKPVEAIIATGSNNSARYFEYYFSRYPHIIRHNRTSCAVLNGNESLEELAKLTHDMLTYYGLGCRSISKIFVPRHYSFYSLLHTAEPQARQCLQNHKYSNNYDYNKSIYLINKVPHYDNGFLLLTESEKWVSPISVVYYQYYDQVTDLEKHFRAEASQIQCVVSEKAWFSGSVPFGTAQEPLISDYADNMDTMRFLIEIGRG